MCSPARCASRGKTTHCGSGYRAAIAASLLDDGTRRLVHIDDDRKHAEQLGLTTACDLGAANS